MAIDAHIKRCKDQGKEVTLKELQKGIDGNLCRCTGAGRSLYIFLHMSEMHNGHDCQGSMTSLSHGWANQFMKPLCRQQALSLNSSCTRDEMSILLKCNGNTSSSTFDYLFLACECQHIPIDSSAGVCRICTNHQGVQGNSFLFCLHKICDLIPTLHEHIWCSTLYALSWLGRLPHPCERAKFIPFQLEPCQTTHLNLPSLLPSMLINGDL